MGDRRWNGVGKIEVMTAMTTDEDSGSNEKKNGRERSIWVRNEEYDREVFG